MSKISKEASSSGADGGERRGAAVRSGHDAVVFLVDGDEAVRDAVATLLRTAGYGVAPFSTARQFLNAYRIGQPGCLVVDLDLPGVESELLRMLASSESPLPVIITSRRLQRRRIAHSLIPPSAVLLDKPFGADDLLPLIRTLIASGRG